MGRLSLMDKGRLIVDAFDRILKFDATTWAALFMSYPHHEAHQGKRFYRNYSVPSLGALTSPDDTISLTWVTPDTAVWEHFTFYGTGTGGWRLRLIEAPTGGAASPTGKFSLLNHQRNSPNVSTALAIDGTAGQVSYDATLATGGVTLWDDYIPGGSKVSGTIGSDRDEIILKQNTKYQLSLFGTDTDPATVHIDWYEHTNKV